jgi:transposase
LADKGYDSDAIRLDFERRGVEPVIPTKANCKRQRSICKKTYALRNRIERFFNKLKHYSVRVDQMNPTENEPLSLRAFTGTSEVICQH